MRKIALSFLVLAAIIAVPALQAVQVAPQPATPTLSVSSRCVTTTYITVTIRTTTSGAELRYTLNGTQPTRADTPIANGGAVNVPNGHTLKARAYKSYWISAWHTLVWVASDVATSTYYCS